MAAGGRKNTLMSFVAEVTTVGDNGVYTPNGMRFATREEAGAYASNLAWRWTAVLEWRVVTSQATPNATYDMKLNYHAALGHIKKLDTGGQQN